MRKYIFFSITILFIIFITATAYAGFDLNKVVNASRQLPYLYKFIQEFFIINNTFSPLTFQLVRIFLEVIISIITICGARNFISQGGTILYKDIKKIIPFGLLAYILILMLLIIFFISFVGFPIGIIILILAYIISFLGRISLQIYIGFYLELYFKQNWHIYLNYLIGVIILEVICTTPYIGKIISLIIVPIITIGIIIQTILNRYIYKIYYTTPFKQHIQQKKYIKEDIRKIILHNIKK